MIIYIYYRQKKDRKDSSLDFSLSINPENKRRVECFHVGKPISDPDA